MLTISWGYVVGYVVVLITTILCQIAWYRFGDPRVYKHMHGKHARKEYRDVRRLVRDMFAWIYVIETVGIIVLMLWVGWGFHEESPVGQLTPPETGTLEHVTGDNRPDLKSEQIKKEALQDQQESATGYDTFRKNIPALKDAKP